MGQAVESIEYLHILQQMSLALGLGLLIGLERQRAGKEIGLRTFSFTALAGFLSWQISSVFSLATLGFVAVMVVVMNLQSLQRRTGVEMTTSVALLLTALVGILVSMGHLFVAVSVIILMLILLSWKDEMVGFSEHISQSEVHAAITLGLLAFVILPVLPHEPIDPWGLFELRKVWVMVVLISAIGFVNYVLLRLYGARSLVYTGFLGGLVNSTATVAELAHRARVIGDDMEEFAFRGIMWARAAMFVRNGLVLAIFAPSALSAGLVPVGLMLLATVSLAAGGRRTVPGDSRTSVRGSAITLTSPFSLRSAMEFGLMFAGLTAVGGIAQLVLGDLGFYAVSFFGGIVSSSSTAATAANLAGLGKITPLVAGSGVVLSSISSVLVSLPLVWRISQRPRLMRRVLMATGVVMFAAALGIAANPLFLAQFNGLLGE